MPWSLPVSESRTATPRPVRAPDTSAPPTPRTGVTYRRQASLHAALLVALLLLAPPAGAVVLVTDPDDATPFFRLDRPTGKFDETGLAGFEFLISSRQGEFRAADQYLIAGEETEPGQAIGLDLGDVTDLTGVSFGFRVEHNLAGGRNFTFRLDHPTTGASSALCWGLGCAADATAQARIGGLAPIRDYNGLQVQARAQDVPGSSAAVRLTSLTGVDRVGADLFDEVVTPDVPGTIFAGDLGRRGQWLLADRLDLVRQEWALAGTVTLSRPDEALTDVTKVRLAIDLVRDPTLAVAAEPAATGLLLPLAGLLGRARLRRGSPDLG